MSDSLSGLNPSHLWKRFEDILKIPHCSGNEKALGDYILAAAKGLGLEAKKDKVGNILARKPASPGHEKAEGVVFQGHLDMVGEKNSDVSHDFAKDAIKASIKGDWVQADGTTLGADNGIGVAACLAIMEDKTLIHGPIEFVFTVEEETGLTGANKLAAGWLKGRKLLNLDSEEEGAFTIGCAGGADSVITLPIKRKKTAAQNLFQIKISGLRGGHSGLDINQGRANAIKLLARLLRQAGKKTRFDLVRVEGGNKRNAIPREARAVLAVDRPQVKKLESFLKKEFENVRGEYKAVETHAAFTFEKSEGPKEFPLTAESQRKFLDLLVGLPHGVVAMHAEIAGLVETSTNLAIVGVDKTKTQIICSTRSSVASALEATRGVLEAVCSLAGAKIILQDGYPGWMPDLNSPLLAKLKDIHLKTTGQEAHVMAVHAGLECGIIGEKYPGMDMISFGPTIEHPHSPDEHVNIGSVERFWTFMKAVLNDLA